jgi:RHS repeat-associated protein
MFRGVNSMPYITAHRVPYLYWLLILFCFVMLVPTSIEAQTTSPTDTTTPLALSPGSPVGSYAVSGFENVNPYNGNLSFHLPLISIGGRGVATSSVLGIDSKGWTVRHVATTDANGFPVDVYTPVANPWTPRAGYGAGKMVGRRSGLYPDQTCGATRYIYQQTLTRLTFIASDGTEYEFRDDLTGGQPAPVTNPCATTGAPRGTVFVTADGNAATFISDAVINDRLTSGGGGSVVNVSGYLMLRDGMRYRVDNGNVSWVRDRNGNKLLFGYTDGRVTSITDSLNRQVTYSYANFVSTFSDQITFKGFGGQNRTILVNYTRLQFSLRTTNPRNEPASRYSIQTYKGLFPELNNASSTTQWNPYVVSSVTLPNNKQYQLFYNCFAELARVTLPTGGAIEYDYTAGSGAVYGGDSYQIYRRVKERRVYHDGTNLEGYTTYGEAVGPVTLDQRNASGTLLSREKHYYHGNPLDSLFNAGAVFYPGYREGREFKTEAYAADGVTVLRRSETTWANRAAVSWWNPANGDEPPNDLRVTDTTTTLTDLTPNLVSRQTFGYDDSVPFNNRSDIYEYDFGSGAAGALIRRTHTDYLTTNPVNSTDYTTTSIHIRSLPTQIQVFDSVGTEKARTTFEYDNYVSDGNHAPLEPRFNISGLDSGFTTSYVTRGNLTRITSWVLSTSAQLHSHNQYDVAGNVVKTIDARGYASTFEFADRYGAPDTEAQGNTAPLQLSGQTSYAFATKVTNAAGHISFAQFDYHLGKPVNGEDPNGIVASGSYNDSLDRPTQIKRAIGTSAENQTTFAYDDTARIVTITADLNSNNDNGLVSKVVYDGLGRSKETRQYEGGTNYISIEQQYDPLGRVDKVSNPYRPYLIESPVWTTTVFDALGRATSVTTPDSAVVSTAYSGSAVTVTDQAGKLRRSITDALGRLTRVDEPNGSNSLGDVSSPNQPTIYSYDVLDNLTGVSQGVQTRTFVYDSLKRLTSASNPESGTITYGYDANGNVTSKIDARSITTTMTYDALNRITTRTYNDSPQTPTISYWYDAQTLPAGAPTFDRGSATGRLVAVTYGSGSSAGTYRGYDQMGRLVRQYQRTDSLNYLVEATYYANSSLQTQTYPAVPGAADRRVVSYTNDTAGRLSAVSSSATSYAPAAGVSSIGYAAHNGLKTETYGNGLIHAIDYNNRLQATEIKLGTAGSPASIVSLGYSYGTTNNNGNVLTHTYSGGGLSYTQSYGYDSLNRLTTTVESGSSWSQTNGYDRYGNRWIDLGGGSQSLYFNTSNNRITGWSYDNAGNLLNDGSHSYTYDGENKISKVDGASAYVYDGEGQRVRKLVGENLRFVYGIGGQLLAEFSGATGSLLKEYIYGTSGLLATIEPLAVNSNGTRYTTPDHLGSPRVVTNSSASLVSRHDYMPFGEELGAGVGGRTTAMGFPGSFDGVRQKFTQKERDTETGLDYFLARYYASTQGRFTGPDEFKEGAYEFWLLGDPSAGEKQALPFGDITSPQSLNKYQYCYNNPLRFVDPNGHDALYVENKDTGQTTIVIPVHFTGPSATPGLIAEVVSRASQLDTGDPNVKIEIVATDKPIQGVLNTMNLSPDLDPKYPKGEGTEGVGGNKAHIRSNGVGSGGGIVHDTLHFAGLKDRYKEGWTMSQKRKFTKPTRGYDNSNIMTSSGGTTLKPEQIREAKDNKSTKKCTTENGVTKCK